MTEPMAPARPRRRSGLALRVALVTTAVAAVAVALAGAVSFGLVRGAARDEAQRQLDRLAGVVAQAVDNSNTLKPGRRGPAGNVAKLLRQQQIATVRVTAGGGVSGIDGLGAAAGLDGADVALLAAGQPVAGIRSIDGRQVFVSGQPTPDRGGGVALIQPISQAAEVAAPVGRRLLVALLIGLAGAAVAGVLLARWLARPLQAAAAAAHRMAAGARDVRLDTAGPAEVAEVAESINGLAGALQVSEGRQREFLLSVSHELRTPLTAITGYAESLADGVVTGDDASGAGVVVLDEARRLDRLVSDLLDLARLGADDFRLDVIDVDLAELVRSAGEVWRRRCQAAGVDFGPELPAVPVRVRTDPVRVRQILDGLAENALRVVPAGAALVFALTVQASCAVLAVRDGGPGLTPEDCAVAFERSALHDRYRGVRRVGTGVGLALVAGLTRRLGGVAQAGRAPEGGAAFTIRLPLAGPPPKASPNPQPEPRPEPPPQPPQSPPVQR